AEYIEISQAYRMGCNVGKQTPKINSENKQAIAKPLSQKEIEERQEIQNYSMEIRNAFSQIRSGAPDLTGQKCSIKVWFSQSGNVLSIKVESGDNDACSYVLKRTQKIKLSAMNDSQYKVFRNTPIDFSF
ncbi:cell envelope integrity TolA C-terminal domain-containing protein, partial [Escherichia coli]